MIATSIIISQQLRKELYINKVFEQLNSNINSYTKNDSPINIVHTIPDEILFHIFSYLNPDMFTRNVPLTCKNWRRLAKDPVIVHRSAIHYLKRKEDLLIDDICWSQHIGIVKKTLLLPKNIMERVYRPCPFWSSKKVYETHRLIYTPKIVVRDDKETILSMNNFVQLATTETRSFDIWDPAKLNYGDIQVAAGRWLLMTKYPIPKSDGPIEAKQTLAEKISSELGYKLPTILELSAAIYFSKTEFKKEFFQDKRIKCAVAKEDFIKTDSYPYVHWKLTVGTAKIPYVSPNTIFIGNGNCPYDMIGIYAALYLDS